MINNSKNKVPDHVPARTDHGEDEMEPEIVTIGEVSYELHRVFKGTRSLTDLMAEKIAQNIPSARIVGGKDKHGTKS